MKNIIRFFLDLIFPVYCLGCGQEGKWLCQSCLRQIYQYDSSSDVVASSLKLNNIRAIVVATDYENKVLIKALHWYKYNFIVELGNILGEYLVNATAEKIKSNIFDLVVPVPLSGKRKVWRGFNQSEILASKVSQRYNIQFEPRILIRKFNTVPQVGLHLEERQRNVAGIFKVKLPQVVVGKKIL